MRILLVEDDEMIGEAVADGLKGEGYAVDWVKDGNSAIIALDTKICTVFHSRELKKHKYRDYLAIVGVKNYQLLRYAIKDGGAYERLSDCNG